MAMTLVAMTAVAQQQDFGQGGGGALAAGFGCLFSLIWIGLLVLMLIGMWKVFVKAGKPGWACIIPIYNIIVLLEIVGKPIWWIVLLLIPLVNIVVAIIVCIALAERFGKGAGYGIGLAILPFIFYPMLGFGDAQYR